MTNLETFNALRDACARVEKVIFIGGSSKDSITDELEEFFEEEGLSVIEQCFGEAPDDVYLADIALEWLIETNQLGYLVQFATPVMDGSRDTSQTYSWGYYRTHWVYAETMDEAISKGLAWVQEQREAEDAKAKKAKGGAA